MKILSIIIMLALAVPCFAQSGVFTVTKTNNLTTFLTIQKGLKPAPIALVQGATYEVAQNASIPFQTTNDSFIADLSVGLAIKVNTNTDFTINSFFQEVQNTGNLAEKARFGSHNLSATLLNGSLTVVYAGGDSNSSCVISTPMADIELHKGVFSFKVTDNKLLVFVLEGSLTSHADKRENVVTAGYAVIAVPNDIGILEAKISIGAEKVKKEIINKLTTDSQEVIEGQNNVFFAVINGHIVGVLLH